MATRGKQTRAKSNAQTLDMKSPAAKTESDRKKRRVGSEEKSAAAEKSIATPARRSSGRLSGATPPTKTKAEKEEPVAPTANYDGLTAFEIEREERIARNKERMAALNIGTLAAEVATKSASAGGPSQRGIGSKRQRAPKEDPGPVRRSLRGQKAEPDATYAGGVDYERRDGTVILTNGTFTGAGVSSEGALFDPGPSRPTGDVPLESVNANERADEAFIAFLRDAMATPMKDAEKVAEGTRLTASAFAESVSKTRPRNVALAPTSASGIVKSDLKLADEGVAKVTPRGVTHLDMAPYDASGPVVVAAGDKDGNVGIWRVDGASSSSAGDDDADGSEDGVMYYRPNGSYICHLKWGRGGLGGKLLTCAYDGAVRALDAEKGVFTELFVSEEDDEFSACDFSADGRAMHLSDNRGNYYVVDARTGKMTSPAVMLHEKKINTVHLEPGAERLFATSCGDQTVQVWDVRKTGKGCKPVSRLQHTKSCQAAYFAPDGSGNLLTTCYDDLLRIWRPKASPGGGSTAMNDDPKSATKIRHNNQTGRWVLPFRAVWTPGSDGVVVGSMKREVELFDAQQGSLTKKFSDPERMTAIASRFAVHPTLNIIAAGTASGRIHVFRR